MRWAEGPDAGPRTREGASPAIANDSLWGLGTWQAPTSLFRGSVS